MTSQHWKDLLLGIFVIAGLAFVTSIERHQKNFASETGSHLEKSFHRDSNNHQTTGSEK